MHKLPPFEGDPAEDTAVSEDWGMNKHLGNAIHTPIWAWVVGALIVALLATAFWAANRVDKDCQKVAGGQGQTLNVCVDKYGNISDGDR